MYRIPDIGENSKVLLERTVLSYFNTLLSSRNSRAEPSATGKI